MYWIILPTPDFVCEKAKKAQKGTKQRKNIEQAANPSQIVLNIKPIAPIAKKNMKKSGFQVLFSEKGPELATLQ